jgi:hypothetical protein
LFQHLARAGLSAVEEQKMIVRFTTQQQSLAMAIKYARVIASQGFYFPWRDPQRRELII